MFQGCKRKQKGIRVLKVLQLTEQKSSLGHQPSNPGELYSYLFVFLGSDSYFDSLSLLLSLMEILLTY